MKHHDLGHRYPQTRREFLSQGLIGLGTYLTLPTFLPEWALAASGSGEISSKAHIPFLVWDLAGGAALPGKGGPEDLLPSYDKLGWNPKTDSFDRRFGLPMAPAQISGVLRGLTENLSPAAQANLRMGSFCHQSQDDSSDNTTSSIIEISKAGLRGTLFSPGLGSRESSSGGKTRVPLESSQFRPVRIEGPQDLMRTAVPKIRRDMGDRYEAVMRTSLNLAKLQTAYLKQRSTKNIDQITKALDEGYAKIHELSSAPPPVTDPLEDPIFKSLYDLRDRDGSQAHQQRLQTASIVRTVLMGLSGPGCIEVPGCDYHNGTSQTGDNKDLEIGRSIGAAVEAAHQLKKPLFFQILTDGGIYPDTGTRIWRGDDGLKGMTVIGYYNPERAPEQIRTQVGSYTDGQAADLTEVIARNTSQVAYAVLANYLNIHGQLGRFESVVSRRGSFTTQELDQVLIFGGA